MNSFFFMTIKSLMILIIPISTFSSVSEDSLIYYENSGLNDLFDIYKLDKSEMILRYEPLTKRSSGFLDNKFKGDGNSFYFNINGEVKKTSFSLTHSKNDGEILIRNKFKKCLSFNINGYKFLIGDYKVNISNGRLISNSFRRSKFFIHNWNSNRFWMDRSSSSHNQFQGLSLTKNYEFKTFQINTNLFISRSNRAANVNSENEITSLYTSNNFRTSNELNKIGALRENLISTGISFENQRFNLASQLLLYKIPNQLKINSNYYFKEQSNIQGSISLTHKSIINQLNVETTFNKKGISGLFIQNNFKKSYINFRFIDENHNNPYSNILTEYSNKQNEIALIIGSILTIDKYKIRYYVDVFKRPRKEGMLLINNGLDIGIESTFKINNSKHRVNFINEIKSDYSKSNEIRRFDRERIRLRTDHAFKLIKNYDIKVQCNVNYLKEDSGPIWGNGILIKQKIKINKLKVNIMTGVFNSEEYANAVWWFDYFGKYNLASLPMYGKGVYLSSNFEYFLNKKTNIQFSISYLKKDGVKEIGSYLDAIKGNEKIRSVFQINYTL